MEYIIALALILLTFLYFVKLSMENIQKLVDKVIAKDYAEYKREVRADEAQKTQMEIEKQFPVMEVEADKDYL